eukprot:GHVQ01003296.1.p1 GENE.GHVQ01003296.1~~GHVQ01003296.1.p1  ORF type:complete len:244 (-),score=26.97 GHVQ01003296.1:148-879(-)
MLLHNRIVYLGLPLSSAITELIVTQLLYLNFESSSRPVYLYINSSGSETPEGDSVSAFETESLAIADVMSYINCPVYTIALGRAWGSAAMLLSLGHRGGRFTLPHTSLLLRQSRGVPGRLGGSGPCSTVDDVLIRAREARGESRRICEIVAKACGREVEEVEEAFVRGTFFTPEEAVKFGMIDRVFDSNKDMRVVPSFIQKMHHQQGGNGQDERFTSLANFVPSSTSSDSYDSTPHRGLLPRV